MIELVYTPVFVKQFKKLNSSLQDEVINKIELFKESTNHKQLKVHKLRGQFKNCYSFSVSYDNRVVFSYDVKKRVYLLAVGSHDVYR
jgi:addiction module RelE/StbE family toxin